MVPSPGSVIVSVGAGPITMIEPAAPAAEASVTPTLKLGTICERLGFTVTADFLASLGFAASHERSAKLYHEGSWPHMKAKLIAHIEGLN